MSDTHALADRMSYSNDQQQQNCSDAARTLTNDGEFKNLEYHIIPRALLSPFTFWEEADDLEEDLLALPPFCFWLPPFCFWLSTSLSFFLSSICSTPRTMQLSLQLYQCVDRGVLGSGDAKAKTS